jgi:hypothetical protein
MTDDNAEAVAWLDNFINGPSAEPEPADPPVEGIRGAVAHDKGLPPNLAGFLQGDNEDDLRRQADVLLRRFNLANPPKADPSQGARGTASVPRSGMSVFADMLATAERSPYPGGWYDAADVATGGPHSRHFNGYRL